MIRIAASVAFWGEAFQPGRAEELTGLVFTGKNEVGDITQTGRYKNQPLPYGWASFEPPAQAEWKVLWLAQQWAGKIDLVRQCGAEDIHFMVDYLHDGQCNCSLSVEEISAINALSISYWFSVYQVDDLNTIP